MRAMTALAGEAALPAQASQDRESDSEPSSADDAAAEGEGTSELTSTAMEDAKTPVHYFVMGPEAGWHSTSAWPPPELAPEPYTLFLGRSSRCAALLIIANTHEKMNHQDKGLLRGILRNIFLTEKHCRHYTIHSSERSTVDISRPGLPC